MKSLYNRKGVRRGDGDRAQFAFFLTGAVVVLAVVFVIGIQVGRVIEKKAASKEVASGKTGGPIVLGAESSREISREIGAFSADAEKVGSPPPPSPEERVRETERSVTFRETLETKQAAQPKLVPPAKEPPAREQRSAVATGGTRLYVQAAAFRERAGAETMRKRLETSGFRAIIATSGSGTSGVVHKVLVGPYPGKSEAGPAMQKIAGEFRTRPFLVRH